MADSEEVNFWGTDTMAALIIAKKYYAAEAPGSLCHSSALEALESRHVQTRYTGELIPLAIKQVN